MEQIPNNSAAACAISLEELRVALKGEPPVGAEVARACRYDARRLARLCGCSLRRLQRIFGDFCRTPDRWIFEHRMLSALTTLEHLDTSGELKSIKWFAIELGYRHPEQFSRHFKRIFGLAPKEFLAERQKALRSLGINRQSYPIRQG